MKLFEASVVISYSFTEIIHFSLLPLLCQSLVLLKEHNKSQHLGFYSITAEVGLISGAKMATIVDMLALITS